VPEIYFHTYIHTYMRTSIVMCHIFLMELWCRHTFILSQALQIIISWNIWVRRKSFASITAHVSINRRRKEIDTIL